MNTKDIILIIIAFLGWIWGIIQFLINHRNQRKDKLIDRKYIAYSTYMKKIDEIMNNIRNNPNIIYGISNDFMKVAITGNEEEINVALLKFNEKLIDYVKRSTEPLFIIKQELNLLLIICSDMLKNKVEELIGLITDFNNEAQKCLALISPNDSNQMIRELQTFAHNERWLRFQELNEEIIKMIRTEIGCK
jgi:hypothetical protein